MKFPHVRQSNFRFIDPMGELFALPPQIGHVSEFAIVIHLVRCLHHNLSAVLHTQAAQRARQ
ncbi:MAG: hypothetical protein KGM47_03855 [Acidobacteriota bacterium]|nr:hypothetical protein [Acidobacteriota bacterium]